METSRRLFIVLSDSAMLNSESSDVHTIYGYLMEIDRSKLFSSGLTSSMACSSLQLRLMPFLDFLCCRSATNFCSRKFLAKLACPDHCRQKVIEDDSIASNRSVVTESFSKSRSSAEVKDEDAAIAAVIDAAELKWEEQSFKRGQAPGRFTSGRHNGHGSSEREAPPPGHVGCSCGVAGHFIQHCPQENQMPPPGYTCYRCRIPGHFIQHCPTLGDPKFGNYKMSRPVASIVSPNPADDILSALAPAASVTVVDDLPAELHCQLCNKVMGDVV